MKAYTDLEQSKKLAEILPLESADMYWFRNDTETPKIYPKNMMKDSVSVTLPCWSLTALYGILPNNKKETTTLSRGGWKIEPFEYLDKWFCEYEDDSHEKDFTVSADNPIDACVEMIMKLKELNLL